MPSPNSGFVAISAGYLHSLGLRPDGPAVGAARLQPDAAFACIYGATVSAAWADVFYIEADKRSCGIRVERSGHSLVMGKMANVAGLVKTNADGERHI